MLRKIAVAYLVCQLFITGSQAQVTTNKQLLTRAAFTHKEKEITAFEHAANLARQKGWPIRLTSPKGSVAVLVAVDPFGYPVYVATDNNITAAATTGASLLWSGGTTGLDLSGGSAAVKDKLAVWDGGSILNSHVELKGRILQRDIPSALSDHSTHVAGTMIGAGINPLAKGMANGAQSLIAYDFNNHISEIMSEASGLLISNHSYGTKAGWSYNNRWEFLGRADENEDYKFGYYNTEAQLFDSIAYNAPFYLIVKSAGNNRGETGPAIGQQYYRYNTNGQMADAGMRPSGISSNDGYDIIATYGTAKNILTVGAVKGMPFGYNKTEEVVMSSFSSWGPTDDGRIKPDIVADGVDVLSSISTSDNGYESMSGTSMASPNASGSLLLLQEYWARLHNGAFMRSATLKALAIHTASEAGDAPGPDYRFGWGVLNVAKAADVITTQNTGSHLISENTLNNNSTFTTTVVASGKGPLVATIVWTDPKGSVETTNLLNNRTPKLVNDLDIRIRKGTTVYKPWILDPAAPTSPAMTGDNILDNVERIDVTNPVPGETYTIEITHKGTLDRGNQAYSLVVSGIGGQAYCTSVPTSNTGARIDSVALGAIQKLNTAGCTTYTNYTATTPTILQASQVLPISVKLNSCDGTSADMIVKVYLDLNNNGNFTDANELLATSGIINGSGVFSGTITVPKGITPGNSSILRIVAQQTATASDVVPCGTYGNGETQDYRVVFGAPASDMSIADIAYPTTACGTTSVYPVIGIRNNGSVDRADIPVKLVVKNGATAVTTLTGTYPGIIAAGTTVTYTFQSPLALAAGNTYTLQAISLDVIDQNNTNDTMAKVVSISTTTNPAGTAEICGQAANLRVANPNPLNTYFWYTTPSASNPVASGAFAMTPSIPANKTYYVGTGVKGTVGLSTNAGFTGGYLNSSSNYMKYSSAVPVFLESVRLYSKSGGPVDFMVADITSQNGSSYSYIPLSTTTVNVLTSSPTPAAGTQAGYDANDTGVVYTLNMLLPAGEHAIIMRMKDATTNLYRNNGVTGNPYPLSFLDVISFTGNSATTTGNAQYYQGFYYYLYDLKVRTLDCISDRTAVVANVAPTPSITLSGDSLVSNITTGNQWYLDGNAIAGASTNSFRPTQSGTYTVSVYSTAGCMQSSNAINYVFTAVPVVVDRQFNLQAVPNPNRGSFTVSFNATRKENVLIEMVSAFGQRVYTKALPNFIGSFTEPLHLEHLSSGVYVLKVQYGDKVQYKKMVIE